MGIAYRDGAENEVLQLVARSSDLSSLSLNGLQRYGDWGVRYHLCPERSNLLRPFDFTGLDVLELGAGMGGASRFIAEHAHSFTAVEGAESRLAALKSRLRDLDDWTAVASNIEDFRTDRRFDVVVMVGVLEYSALYIHPTDGTNPYVWALRHAASMLKPGGQLVVAIENRNGLKYWAGAPEDHTNRMYGGICGYGSGPTPRTFSRKGLLELLQAAGLSSVEEFYPWPDYKTPTAVISKRFADRYPMLAAEIAGDATRREPGATSRTFPKTLAVHEVARSGLFGEMANSFLFVAGADAESAVRRALLRRMAEGEAGWHYTVRRKEPASTAFALEEDGSPSVLKGPIEGATSHESYQFVVWRPKPRTPVLPERAIVESLRRCAYDADVEGFEGELKRFLGGAIAKWQLDERNLEPVSFDANVTNIVETEDGFDAFDLEWIAKQPVPKSWFVLRNLMVLDDALAMFPRGYYPTVGRLYESLCRSLDIVPDLAGDMEREAAVQVDIHRGVTMGHARQVLRHAFKRRRRPAPYPRDPVAETRFRRAACAPNPAWALAVSVALTNPALRRLVGPGLGRLLRLLLHR